MCFRAPLNLTIRYIHVWLYRGSTVMSVLAFRSHQNAASAVGNQTGASCSPADSHNNGKREILLPVSCANVWDFFAAKEA